MRLFHSETSPYARKVKVLILEAGLQDRVTLTSATVNAYDPKSLPSEVNPLGKIPALERPDGPALYDSRVICRYLDDMAQAGFYPPAPALWDVLTLEATADGILDASVLIRYETVSRPDDRIHLPWVESQWSKIERALDMLETRWMDVLEGPRTICQIAVGCALGYLDFRQPDRGWRQGRPRLAVWEAHFATRPAMQATRPPAL